MTFQQIYTLIISKAPELAAKNTHIIREWLASYDTEKDILPAIEIALKRGVKTIYSFAFFTGYIRRQHEERIKREAQATERPSDAAIARSRAYLVRKLGKVIPADDMSWLLEYERLHGEVKV